MKKINPIINVLLLLLLPFCFLGCTMTLNGDADNVEGIDINKYYKITKNTKSNEVSYTYVIYDSTGKVVLKDSTTKEPRIRYVSSGVLEILTNHGSSASLCSYYDIQNNILSQSFWNPSFVDGTIIIYMDFNENRDPNTLLIIQNIFNKNILYEEIVRDFSPTAVVSMAVESVKFVDQNTIELTYLRGTDFISTTETIKLEY